MGLFFNYDNPVCNEGMSSAVFSYDPSISSLKELLIYELSQLSYYEVKLRELNYDTQKTAGAIINYITLIVVNLDFRKDRFLNIIKNLYDNVQKLKSEYEEHCKKNNLDFLPIVGEQLSFKTKKENIDVVNFGEKQSLLKNTVISKNKKILSDIAVLLISNACLCITEIENYGFETDKIIKSAIPNLLKKINYDEITDNKLKTEILNFAKINNSVMMRLNQIIIEKYGPVEETDVNFSTQKGKCILVSGHYYQNLEKLLQALQNTDINVYTHNEMIFAHSYTQLKKYKNLIGHYQKSLNNFLIDFASFPGAILVTKNSHPHIDAIRGRIFTPDNNPAYGISKVSENDFSPLIDAAQNEAGFKKDSKRKSIAIGYDEQFIRKKVKDIILKFKNNEFDNLIIIGQTDYDTQQSQYFEKLLNKISDNDFVISFSYQNRKTNIWHIEPQFDMSLFYIIIDELKTFNDILSKGTGVFLPKCNLQAVSHAFNLKISGIKNIFIGQCCPNVLNPTIFEGMKKLFSIRTISGNPLKDLSLIKRSSKFDK